MNFCDFQKKFLRASRAKEIALGEAGEGRGEAGTVENGGRAPPPSRPTRPITDPSDQVSICIREDKTLKKISPHFAPKQNLVISEGGDLSKCW